MEFKNQQEMDTFIHSWERLILRIIQRRFRCRCREDFEDLVQEGYLALCRAISSFDESKGRFSTFASRTIYNEILKSIYGSAIIHIPQSVRMARMNLKYIINNWDILVHDSGLPLSAASIAKLLDCQLADVIRVIQTNYPHVSLFSAFESSNERLGLMVLNIPSSAPCPETTLLENEGVASMLAVISECPEPVRSYVWDNTIGNLDIGEIAEKHGVSRRKIVNAIKKAGFTPVNDYKKIVGVKGGGNVVNFNLAARNLKASNNVANNRDLF